ncbi:ABC transporter substrate-binding protein [Lacisediminihabitans sp.]|uniref:ABC transporter substrate-binding protein n=1 Tax=Lacisediminihabitans sp. TaxID=2787631 RepID=UPI00374D030F
MTPQWSRIPRTHPAPTDVPRRTILAALVLGGATAAGLSACTVVSGGVGSASTDGYRLAREAGPGRERTIEIFNIWGGMTGNAWVSIAELYEKSQTHTGVKVTYAPASADSQVRLLTSIAAGSPPDVAFVQPEQYPQFAGLGVMNDLDPYLQRSGLGEKDFVPAVWSQMSITGPVYSLPGMVDVNFPLFWNKKLFSASGLDPNEGPKTIDDMDRMSAAILKKKDGRVQQVGTIPWSYYGYSNSMYTLGYAFGGKFVSDDNGTVTPDHENNITALTWMCDYAKRVGGAAHLAVTSPTQVLPAIAGGTIGMAPMTATDAGNVKTNAPKVELGSGLFPYAEGLGEPGGATWLGGWSVFIPKGAAYPDSAWDFIQFATTTAEGTIENFKKQRAVPELKSSPVLKTLAKDPFFSIFTEALSSCKNVRPTIPVAGTYGQQLDIYVGQAIFGQLTPQQAMKKVADNVNTEWDRFRKDHQS